MFAPKRRELQKVECENCGELTHHPVKYPFVTLCQACSEQCVACQTPASPEIVDPPLPVCKICRDYFRDDEDLRSFIEQRKYDRNPAKCKGCSLELEFIDHYKGLNLCPECRAVPCKYCKEMVDPEGAASFKGGKICINCLAEYCPCKDCGSKLTPMEISLGTCNTCDETMEAIRNYEE